MAGSWERRGTVTVTQNSNIVKGVGTYWTDAKNGPQVGNTFYGPDGQAHEVSVIRSATELLLADNYKGATAAGVPYQIDTTRVDSVPGLASRVAAVLGFAQGQYDNLDKWTQGGVDQDVTLTSPNGESVTVPSLPKLGQHAVTPGLHLPAIGGGMAGRVLKAGSAAGSAAWGTLTAAEVGAYHRGNIIGAVSQSGGVPTGAIIQRGSNANGEFVRYADGTQVCMTTIDLPVVELYQQATVLKAHPIAFSQVDTVQFSAFAQIGTGSQAAVGLVYSNGIYTSKTSADSLCLASYTYRHAINEPVRFNVTTHGRWY